MQLTRGCQRVDVDAEAIAISATVNESGLSYSELRKKGHIATNQLRIEVLYKYLGRCFLCGIEEWRNKARLDMHRVLPGKQGGLYTIDNVIPVCGKCHSSAEGLNWDELNLIQSEMTKTETNIRCRCTGPDIDSLITASISISTSTTEGGNHVFR